MSSNSRHYLVILSLLVSIVAYGNAFSHVLISSAVSAGSLGDRITQLESIANAHSQLLTQLQQQLSDNQNDIDLLRGQIQENQYRLNQAVAHQKKILLQVDESFNRANRIATQTATGSHNSTAVLASKEKAWVNSVPVQSSNDNVDYNAAVALLQDKSQHDNAIVAFQSFLKKYPDSTYQPNANYWLGQLTYNKGKKDDAAFYFASVVKNYPKSSKASSAMFKIGLIMQDKGDIEKAKAVYQQVLSKYPGTDSAKKAQKRLNSMR